MTTNRTRHKRSRRITFLRLVSLCILCVGILGYLFLTGSILTAETPTSDTIKHGGTLRLAMAYEPRCLDPALIWSEDEGILVCLLFDSLLDYDAQGNFVPALAESLPVVSSDGLIYTFTLRPVRFSNGRELVAQDVVFTLERYFDPKTGASASGYFNSIHGCAAL